MRKLEFALIALIAFAVPAAADEFASVVKGIESHYGIQRSHPQLINFAAQLTEPEMRGSGTAGLKVAVFENENRTFAPSLQQLDEIIRASLGPQWRPFVRISSRRNGESAVIYADFSSKNMGMMIVSMECDEIAVVQIKIDGKTLERWIADPVKEARNSAQEH